MIAAWNRVSNRPDVLRVLKSMERESALPMVRHTVKELTDYADWMRVYQNTLDLDQLEGFLSKLNSVERDAVAVLMGKDQSAKSKVKRLVRSRLMRTSRAIATAVKQVESEK